MEKNNYLSEVHFVYGKPPQFLFSLEVDKALNFSTKTDAEEMIRLLSDGGNKIVTGDDIYRTIHIVLL